MGRITGLDAAYPLYMNTGNEGHLARTDAAFVDVIHTDGGILGFPNPLGHVDFYPNGGKSNQPGCNLENAFQRSFSRFINQYSKKNRNPFLAQISRRKASPLNTFSLLTVACGHHRAWMFYAESVTNPFGFPASRCAKWRPDIKADCEWTPQALMGFAVDPRVRGKFYLRTNAQPPFARNATGYWRFGFGWTKLLSDIFRESSLSRGIRIERRWWKRKKKRNDFVTRKRKMKIVPFYYTKERGGNVATRLMLSAMNSIEFPSFATSDSSNF